MELLIVSLVALLLLIVMLMGILYFWMASLFNNSWKAFFVSVFIAESILGMVYYYANS